MQRSRHGGGSGPPRRAGNGGDKEPDRPEEPIRDPDEDPRRPGSPGTPIEDPRPEKPERKV